MPSRRSYCHLATAHIHTTFPSDLFLRGYSFTRRLRRWGFHRMESVKQRSRGIIIFTCPHFKRGRSDLVKKMCDDRQFKQKSKAAVPPSNAPVLTTKRDGGLYTPSLLANTLNHYLLQPALGLPPSSISSAVPIMGTYGSMPVSVPISSTLGLANPMMLPETHLQHMHGLASPLHSTGFGRGASEIRASIDRIEAELAVISSLRREQDLHLLRMTGHQLGGEHKDA